MRIDELNIGSLYRREEWPLNYNVHLNSKEETFYDFTLFHKGEIIVSDWSPSIADISADNWELYSEKAEQEKSEENIFALDSYSSLRRKKEYEGYSTEDILKAARKQGPTKDAKRKAGEQDFRFNKYSGITTSERIKIAREQDGKKIHDGMISLMPKLKRRPTSTADILKAAREEAGILKAAREEAGIKCLSVVKERGIGYILTCSSGSFFNFLGVYKTIHEIYVRYNGYKINSPFLTFIMGVKIVSCFRHDVTTYQIWKIN